MADVGKRTGSVSSNPRGKTETEAAGPQRKVDPLRTYFTSHWHLQPELQLLSWAPGSVHFQNPPFEWLVEMLGFKHPKDTIPKWTQRTLMDPLDVFMSAMAKGVGDLRKITE